MEDEAFAILGKDEMIMIRVGVIADTHDILKEEVLNELKQCDYIIHAGDIVDIKILERLQTITKVFVVKGNNDKLSLNEEEYFNIGGYSFYLVHQLDTKKDVDFYIYGHSHQLGRTLYLNPGSCGKKRFSLPLTYIILDLYEDHYEFLVKECSK